MVRLQLRLLPACCNTQALTRLTFIQLLDALETDLSEMTDLLVTGGNSLVGFLFFFRGTALGLFVLINLLLVGFDVFKEVYLFLFRQVIPLRVGVVHGDIVIRKVLIDDFHFILWSLSFFFLLIGKVYLLFERIRGVVGG